MSSRDKGELTIDTALDLLSNERRRHTLCLLVERDEEVEIETIAEEIVAKTDDSNADEIADDIHRSVYVSLYQNHVPKLAEEGIVHYDRDDRTVRIAHTPETRELLHSAGAECGRSWSLAYLLVLAAGVLAGLVSIGGLLPVTEAWLATGIVSISGLASLAGYQYHTRYRISVSDWGDFARDGDNRV